MHVHTNTVFIPGDAKIDFIEAIEKAVQNTRDTRPLNVPVRYIGRTRRKINNLASNVRLPQSLPRLSRQPNGIVKQLVIETKKEKEKRIRRELIDAGITIYGLLKAESRSLHKVLHPNEHVEAIVYGQHHSSSVMLVATDERIIFIDKKPMAVFLDEVSYEVISGLEFEIHTFFATLILHTPVKNYDIRYANLHCAENFARHIEARRLKRTAEEGENASDESAAIQAILKKIDKKQTSGIKEDLAGYYWLPTEEEERE